MKRMFVLVFVLYVVQASVVPKSLFAKEGDSDGDGIVDKSDTCVTYSNPNQEDQDQDNWGDVCDNCPTVSNTTQRDTDADNVGDRCDNCIGVSNADQADADSDNIGDACTEAEKNAKISAVDFGLWAQMDIRAPGTHLAFSGIGTLLVFLGEYKRWGIGCELGAGITAARGELRKNVVVEEQDDATTDEELDGGRLSLHLGIGVVYEAMTVLTNGSIDPVFPVGIGFAYDMYALDSFIVTLEETKTGYFELAMRRLILKRLTPSLRVKIGDLRYSILEVHNDATRRVSRHAFTVGLSLRLGAW